MNRKIIMLCACIFAALILSGCRKKETVFLLKDEEPIILERGESLDIDLRELFDESTGDEVLEKTVYKILNVDDLEVVNIALEKSGVYRIVFTCSLESEELQAIKKLVVIDTIPPEVKVDEDSAVDSDTDLYSLIKTEEGASVRIEGSVDFDVPGTYEVIYIVSDEDGNESRIARKINVEEKKKTYLQSVPSSSKAPTSSTPSSSSSSEFSSSDSGSYKEKTPYNSAYDGNGCYVNGDYRTPLSGNSGMLFGSESEAVSWAENNMGDYDGYGVGSTYCGLFTIDFYRSDRPTIPKDPAENDGCKLLPEFCGQ